MAEIMVTVAIIAVITAIVIPTFIQGSRSAQTRACIANLRIIDQAKVLWAQDTDASSTSVPGWGDLVNTYIKKTPGCPAGGTYTIGSFAVKPTCTRAGHVLP